MLLPLVKNGLLILGQILRDGVPLGEEIADGRQEIQKMISDA